MYKYYDTEDQSFVFESRRDYLKALHEEHCPIYNGASVYIANLEESYTVDECYELIPKYNNYLRRIGQLDIGDFFKPVGKSEVYAVCNNKLKDYSLVVCIDDPISNSIKDSLDGNVFKFSSDTPVILKNLILK